MGDPGTLTGYIGRYRIVRPLGEGGMGRVLLAEVAGAGGFARQVVLKVVRDELDEALKQALLDEARLTATLVHRNIVPVLDLHESGAQRLVVLEYIDGMDLRHVLDRTPLLDWPLAAFVAGELAAALDFAHRRQIIHRDVSPANVLVSWEGEVKLGDFGVAKVVGGPGKGKMGPTVGLKGKLGYMAPEQMQGKAVDPRADIYALGVVMYEMLTGKNPRRTGAELKPLPKTVPSELAAIVKRATARDREERWASAADLREAILHVKGQPADPARMLADFMVEVRPRHASVVDEALMDAVLGGKPATRMAARRQPHRWRAPLVAAGAALLLLSLLGGGGVLMARRLRVHALTAPPRVTAPPTVTPDPVLSVLPPPTPPPAPAPTPVPAARAPVVLAPEPIHRKPKPKRPGTLSVNAIPWANLFVDGKPAGHTPRRSLPMEPGRHQLRLVTEAGEARARTVEIAPGRETKVTVVFSEP